MKNSKDSKKIGFIHSKLPELKKMHRFIGYSIYILTKFSVFTGVWIYDDKGFLYLNFKLFLKNF